MDREDNIEVRVSGPIRFRIGREIKIPYKHDMTIDDIINVIREKYISSYREGHHSFDDVVKQVVIYIDGRRWNGGNVKLRRGVKIDIVHIINGG